MTMINGKDSFVNLAATTDADEIDELEAWHEIYEAEHDNLLTLDWCGFYAGSNRLNLFRGQYYVDHETATEGPFATLEEALEHYLFNSPWTPEPELWCDPDLLELRRVWKCAFNTAGRPGGLILVNGVRYRRNRRGQLVRLDDRGRPAGVVFRLARREPHETDRSEDWATPEELLADFAAVKAEEQRRA